MAQASCGLLLYRHDADALRVLIVHPGGPYWRQRDAGAWSIPKGLSEPGETPEATALREFAEELGTAVSGPLHPLGSIRQRGGKQVDAFALEGDFDVATLRSNLFDLQWPPGTGRVQPFPEVDRAAWCTLDEARIKLLPAQTEFLDRLAAWRAAG